jgi:hypothetical protein
MSQYDLRWLIKQKNIMLDKITSIAKRLQNARKQIAKAYVYALETQFPDEDAYKLIKIADVDLQNSNKRYRQLTETLIELQEFNQGPFSKLVEMTRQTRQI